MSDFVHRVDRQAALLALAEIRFGHLDDGALSADLTTEIRRRDAPLQDVRVDPARATPESAGELARVVSAVMRRG